MTDAGETIGSMMDRIGREAVAAAALLARAPREAKDRALLAAAAALRCRAGEILAANGRDLEGARAAGLSTAMLDRLALDERRLDGIARGM